MRRLNILVTGGAGYLGSILVPALLDAGHRVTVLDNFMFRQDSLAARLRRSAISTSSAATCARRGDAAPLLQGADIIIPLAALVGAPLCDRDPLGATYAPTATPSDAAAGCCRRTQRVLMPMTNSGYGVGEKGKFCTEESPLRPISLYGATRSRPRQALLDRGNAISFRLATVFGMSPRMRIDLLVNDFVYRAVHRPRRRAVREPLQAQLHPRPRRRPRLPARARQLRRDEGPALQCRPVGRQPVEARAVRASSQGTCRTSSFWRRRSARTRTSATTSSRTRRSRRPAAGRATRSTRHPELIKGYRMIRNSVYGNV